MHAVFMLWGKVEEVENFLVDIRAQKYQLPIMNKKGKKTEEVWIDGQLRIQPFGLYEVVFPREYENVVLTTLHFHEAVTRKVGNFRQAVLRKMFKCKPIPKDIDTSKQFLWRQLNVGIIPIGVRYDEDIIDGAPGKYNNTIHEGI